ncbi:hypothetical protein [Acinetobacter baumannii]|uniref:Uncharacterized protein n=1 Tax=Acinetobacter baumannii TaxID=470 RepID=A0ABD5D965_ACIBA|nr:hypothetical protein [Acinetobacter baumannii]EHU2760883.1 hypothetical protein [Acinetobacter baumannii]EHU3119832.1 hypothetical protein [Acinetobacter baumannii]EKV7389851.1 hypothetical protein [Acinetobacter baumannii]EKW3202905.1 hypothetical protein [Acinetobacter baumannii]EKX0107483.1 hypothetical protein [Acinetobacter baumannii]
MTISQLIAELQQNSNQNLPVQIVLHSTDLMGVLTADDIDVMNQGDHIVLLATDSEYEAYDEMNHD